MNKTEIAYLQTIVESLQKLIAESSTDALQQNDVDKYQNISQMVNAKLDIFKCDILTSSDIAAYLNVHHLSEFGMVSAKSAGYMMRKVAIAAKIRAGKPYEDGGGTLNLWVFRNYSEYNSLKNVGRYMAYSDQINKWLSSLVIEDRDAFIEMRNKVKDHAAPKRDDQGMKVNFM